MFEKHLGSSAGVSYNRIFQDEANRRAVAHRGF